MFVAIPLAAFGQQPVTNGMVWSVPGDLSRAQADLVNMAEAGVEAVRTPPIRDPRLLHLADELDLTLYIDLPVAALPARHLTDTLGFARSQLDSVLARARDHASIRYVGLARHSDTSDSTACSYFEALTDYVRARGPARVNTYYLTRFVQHDTCGGAVDLVLFDLLDRENPAAVVERRTGRSDGSGPFGIGALGTWVRGDSLRGLSVDGSAEQQARYIERNLRTLRSDTLTSTPEVVFVYRWRDAPRETPTPAQDLQMPLVHRYGLHELDGTARPSMEVVRGIFTGEQTIFALDRGRRAPAGASWTTIIGWCLLAVLAIFYALSPRFRHMIPRYFQAHFFFRESVREGREVLFGANSTLLIVMALSCGVIGFVLLDAVRATDAFQLLLAWLPEAFQQAIVTLLATPWALVILIASLYVLGILVWTIILSLVSHRGYDLAPPQALMITLWPRWPILLVLVAAISLAASDGVPLQAYALLLGAWLVVELSAVARTTYDFLAITRVHAPLLIPCLLLYPGTLVLGTAAILIASHRAEVEFLWHALTRS